MDRTEEQEELLVTIDELQCGIDDLREQRDELLGTAFVCPCRRCPRCGYVNTDPEHDHPDDGLAYCPRCGDHDVPLSGFEWWTHVGPRATRGQHLTSPEQMAEWSAYDREVMRTGVEPEQNSGDDRPLSSR